MSCFFYKQYAIPINLCNISIKKYVKKNFGNHSLFEIYAENIISHSNILKNIALFSSNIQYTILILGPIYINVNQIREYSTIQYTGQCRAVIQKWSYWRAKATDINL